MPSIVLSNDSYVVTARGVVLVAELEAGVDQLSVLRPNGSIQPSALGAIRPLDGTAWRVLTAAGDLILGNEAVAMTGDGPLNGQQIFERLASGVRVRVDTVSPSRLPIENSTPHRLSTRVARASLRHLRRSFVRLPHNGASEHAWGAIERILSAAHVDWQCSDDERWLTYRFDQASVADAESVGVVAIADPLMSLTAWEIGPGGMTCRVRADETLLLAALTSALTANKLPYTVSWIPGFYPVECRVSKSAEPWPVFLDALTVSPIATRLSRLEIELGGKAISGTSFIG